MPKLAYSILLILLPAAVVHAGNFEFTPGCVQAYQAAISLKTGVAKPLIMAEKHARPENLVPVFLENYLDFFELFLNEDPEKYAQLREKKRERFADIAAGPGNSPLRGYMLSVMHLQWAVVDMKFNNKIAAGLGFRDALKTIRENQKKFPDFSPNLMISGPVQMTAASVPKGYRWLSSLAGISGNLQNGRQQMEQFLKAGDYWARLFRDEGIFYHCYLQFYLLNEPEEALAFIRRENLDLVNKHIFTFMAANLYLNNKQSRQVFPIVQNRNKSAEYMATGVWDFELAYANLYRLDTDAELYFKRYLQQFKGAFYVKDTWLKLSYHYLIHGQMKAYHAAIGRVKSEGKLETEADKRAYREATSGVIPHVLLLKARLLNDGGYHREALQLLQGKSSSDFGVPVQRLEFSYRLGRIYDDLGWTEKALQAYEITFRSGKNAKEYFAARAALQMGLLHEKSGNWQKAIENFNLCISLEGHDYENALEQKAEAGLARCRLKLKST